MNILELSASLGLDTSEYDKKLNELSQTTASGSGGMGNFGAALSSFAGNLASNIAMKALNVVTESITGAINGVIQIGEQAYSAYASYEQLIGGVETLFGDSAGTIQQYADNAYKTAGMSANAYMEAVTGFSASLLQGLDGSTGAAAEYADAAIKDMSDNANKMGTNIQSIQNAYQGFAKQNYTMLDNLKLGYGGTKEEMERLLADASELSGKKFDIGNFADTIEAIHTIQIEMGITGTTAAEASETIEGSTLSMKAAWENLIAGLGNPDADLGLLVENMVDSAMTMLGNMIPTVVNIMSGVLNALGEFIPEAINEIPGMIETYMPIVFDTITGIVDQLYTLFVDGIVANYPQILENGLMFLMQFTDGILDSLDYILDVVFQLIDTFVELVEKNYPTIYESGNELLMKLLSGLLDHLPEVIDAVFTIIQTSYGTMIRYTPMLVSYMPEIISKLIIALIECIPEIIICAVELIVAFVTALADTFRTYTEAGYWVDMAMSVANAFTSYDWLSLGKHLIDGIVDGIWGNVQNLWDSINGIAENISATFKSALGIASPSKVFKYYGRMIDEGLIESLDDGQDEVHKSALNLADSVTGVFDDVDLATSLDSSISVSAKNSNVETLLADLINAVMNMDSNMSASVKAGLSGASLSINNREFGRIVKGVV